jgi:hypothetical protein
MKNMENGTNECRQCFESKPLQESKEEGLHGFPMFGAKMPTPPTVKEEQPMEDYSDLAETPQWGAWKIVSNMLDNPNEYGIYPTSKCYKELYDFVCERERIVLAHQKEQQENEFKKILNSGRQMYQIGIKEGKEQQKEVYEKIIKKHNAIIKERLEYCEEQNGRDSCKNCGLNEEDDIISLIQSNNKENGK